METRGALAEPLGLLPGAPGRKSKPPVPTVAKGGLPPIANGPVSSWRDLSGARNLSDGLVRLCGPEYPAEGRLMAA